MRVVVNPIQNIFRAPRQRNEPPLKARVSSFPFVSGDTFRLFAGYETTTEAIEKRSRLSPTAVYSDVSIVSKPSFVENFLRNKEGDSSFNPSYLLVHGGDKPPDLDTLAPGSKGRGAPNRWSAEAAACGGLSDHGS